MTFRHCRPYFLLVSLVLFSNAVPAQEPDSNQQSKQAVPDQGQDPLKHPLASQQKSKAEKEGKHYRDWKRDVKWIITPEELAAFNKLSIDVERDNFIEIFWIHCDPAPDTEENDDLVLDQTISQSVRFVVE